MSDSPASSIQELVEQLEQGNEKAVEQLMPLVYDELRRLAERLIQYERPDPALEATALVHEAYMRLVGQTAVAWHGKTHFFSLAATMIRRALVDHVRERNAAKRGGALNRVALRDSVALLESKGQTLDLLTLHDALGKLEQLHPRQARVTELRFFGGLSVEETAEVLGLSPRTVKEDWRFARAWLQLRMSSGAGQ